MLSRSNSRRRSDEELVSNSRLFDPEWYLQAYPDVSRAKVDPLRHYMEVGWREGRNPGPDFATSAYLKANLDVAMAGVNPLLHFIEFGHSEGRASTAHRPLPQQRDAIRTDFGPAAPCASFPLPPEVPVRWRRAHALERGPELFSAGDCAVGYAADEPTGNMLESAFRLLALLSGSSEPGTADAAEELPRSAGELADAWFVNDARLRIRWQGEAHPMVLRAYQHDPFAESRLCMVGEGLASSPLDALDLHLRNRFFPVLLVSAAPDGAISGATMLPFPSFCRGGAHYAELLCSSAAIIDPLATGEHLASRLLEFATHSSKPAIGGAEVDIAAADGRGQMFQKDLQLWLGKVLGVPVQAVGARDGRGADFLAEAVDVKAPGGRGPGATLIIDHDMVPTIAVLTAASEPGEAYLKETCAAVLLAGAEPSQPAIEIKPPSDCALLAEALAAPVRWPRIRGYRGSKVAGALPAAAIRFCAPRSIADAVLFEPIADLPSREQRPAISWIVDARGWKKGLLAQAIHALALQSGAERDWLFWLGSADRRVESVAGERFAGRVKGSSDMKAAVHACETPLVGFLAPGVIVHDRRCADVLASLLDDELIATASCAIVNVKQSGAGWSAFDAEAAPFATIVGARLGPAERDAAVAGLWGSSYPVTLPTRHLWLARKASLADWLNESPPSLGRGLHICCSAVTASHAGGESQVPPFVPPAIEQRATQVGAFFG